MAQVVEGGEEQVVSDAAPNGHCTPGDASSSASSCDGRESECYGDSKTDSYPHSQVLTHLLLDN